MAEQVCPIQPPWFWFYENCFGLCLTPDHQVLLWVTIGLALSALLLFRRGQSQSLKAFFEFTQKHGTQEETASLLEKGEKGVEICTEAHLPVCAASDEMERICWNHGIQNGLEAAGLAVLTALLNRREYKCPSIGAANGSEYSPVHLELHDGHMTFLSLLAAADQALLSARGQGQSQPEADHSEIKFIWGRRVTGSGVWSLIIEDGSQAVAIFGTSPDQELSFKLLFEACATDPEGNIWHMPLYPNPDIVAVESWGVALKDFSQYRDMSNGQLLPIPNLILSRSMKHPTAEAVAGNGFIFTYEDLRRAVYAVAFAVRENVCSKDTKGVVVFMGRGEMLAPSFLGTLQAGCTAIPVDVHWPADRVRVVAADSKAGLVLTDAASTALWSDVGLQGLDALMICGHLISDQEDVDCKGSENLVHLEENDDAVVLFTSGSTGKPKGIILSHGYLTALVAGVAETKEMNTETRALSYHSPTWMPFLDYLMGPLLKGGCCLLYPEIASHVIKPDELSAFATEKKATLLGLVPPVLDVLLDNKWPTTIRTLGSGGAAVTAQLMLKAASTLQNIGDQGFLLTTGYSGTEQGDVTNIRMRSMQDVQKAAGKKAILGAGTPHTGQSYVLVDAGMSLVGPDCVGEVMVSGPGLATGYLNSPQQTSDYFVMCQALGGVRAARTGDLARWTDGQLELVGRLGSMVKVRGARIDLGEVEVAIVSHSSVKSAVVVVQDDRLVAYVEPAVPADLREHCKASLVAYMVPHKLAGLDKLPRLSNGKVDKKSLEPVSFCDEGSETVMELDSLGQMRKFSRKDAAEDVVLDNVRAVLLGIVILSHAVPLNTMNLSIEGPDRFQMIHGGADLNSAGQNMLSGQWLPWQYWLLYLLRSGGWSSLAFLSGFDDTRAEHEGYALSYREVLFVALWHLSIFHWSMWYLPAFVVMRATFVACCKMGGACEYLYICLLMLMFLVLPAFVDLYIGLPAVDSDQVCTCLCPFQVLQPVSEYLAYYLFGFWNTGTSDSYLGHRLIFVPCYFAGLYSGKYLFPLLCKLAKERRWSRRGLAAAIAVATYVGFFHSEHAIQSAYDDRCKSFWRGGSFVWLQVFRNVQYLALNLSMSLLYVVVIAALVPVHLKTLSKNSFFALLLAPLADCALDLSAQALEIRQAVPSFLSPYIEMTWVILVPFLYEFVSGAACAWLVQALLKAGMPLSSTFHVSCLSARQMIRRCQKIICKCC